MKKKKLLALSLAMLLALGTLCGCDDSSAKNSDDDFSYEETGKDDSAVNDSDDGFTEGAAENELLYDDDIYFFLTGDWMYWAGSEVRYFEEIGYEVLGGDQTLASGDSDAAGVVIQDDNIPQFHITVYNPTDSDITCAESAIGGFKLRKDSATEDLVKETEVYGGIRLGSTKEDVEYVFGAPSSTVGSTYVYRNSDPDKFYKFSFDEDGKVDIIEWRNLSAPTLLQNREEQESEKETDTQKEDTGKLGSQDTSLLKPYLGRWAYENNDRQLAISADFTWSSLDGEKWSYAGTFTVDADRIYLYDKEDIFLVSLESISGNNLMDDTGENLFRYIAD